MSSKLLLLYCAVGVYGKSYLNLGPNDFFHHHPLEVKTLGEDDQVEPTKNGPVLFPSDGPPPPKTPLIVTSRPLIESIARSELNPEPNTNFTYERHQKGRIKQLKFLKETIPKTDLIKAKQLNDPHNLEIQKAINSRRDFVPETIGYYQERNRSGIDYSRTPIVLVDHVTGNTLDYIDFRQSNPEIIIERRPRYKEEEGHRTNSNRLNKALGQFVPQHALQGLKPHKSRAKGNIVRPDDSHHSNNEIHDDKENANYAFSYKVKDQKNGDDFSHTQQSSGVATNGEYRVLLPDGRTQIVTYTADNNGYKADVRYAVTPSESLTEGINHRLYNNKDYNDDNYFIDYSHLEGAINHNSIDNHIGNTNIKHAPTEKFHESVINNYPDNYIYDNNDNVADTTHEDYEIDYDDETEYDPHKDKFRRLGKTKNPYLGVIVVPNNEQRVTTLSPLIQGLRQLFTTRRPNSEIPVEIQVPSTTAPLIPRHEKQDTTTEKVVLIGGKNNLYTNIQQTLPFFARNAPQQYTEPTTTPRPSLPKEQLQHKHPYYFTSSISPETTEKYPHFEFPTVRPGSFIERIMPFNQRLKSPPDYSEFSMINWQNNPLTQKTTTGSPFRVFPTLRQSYTTLNPYNQGSQFQHESHLTINPFNLRSESPKKFLDHQNLYLQQSQTREPYQIVSTTQTPYHRGSAPDSPYHRSSTVQSPYQSTTTAHPFSRTSISPTVVPTKRENFAANTRLFTRSFIDKIKKYISF